MTKPQLKHTKQVSTADGASTHSHGVLTEWNDERGYGFITPDDGGQKVFLHIKSLLPSARRPIVGEEFSYKLTTDDKGRPRAEVAFQMGLDDRRHTPLLDERRSTPLLDVKRRTPFFHSLIKGLSYFWPLAIIPAFIFTVITGNLVLGVCVAFFVNSLLTLLFYWEDKYRAQNNYWRISEKCLHIWGFLCGWPGALYAQYVFRHKRSKISFMIGFWFCVIANVISLFWLFYQFEPMKIGNAFRAWWQEVSSLYD